MLTMVPTVDHAPEIRVKQPPLVVHRDVGQPAVDRNAGIVDPRVERPELSERDVGDAIHFFWHRDVGDDVRRPAAAHVNLFDGNSEIPFIPRRQHHAGSARGCHPRRRQTDPARRARDDDHLIAQSLRFPLSPHHCHVPSDACKR
jgi:hypothetical protein